MKKMFWPVLTSFIFIALFTDCANKPDNIVEEPTVVKTTPDTVLLTKSWEKPIPNIELPMGMTGMSAAECGKCHMDVYAEWKMSTHSHAWTDLQYQAELEKNNNLFICINCHLPLQNQQEEIITAILDNDYFQTVSKPNPKFDKELQQEGITCLGCHIKDGNIVGANPDAKPPHSHVVDKDHLSESLCLRCHNAAERINDQLVCTFETGDEWQQGPFSKSGINCIGCHMPEVERQLITGPETKKGFRHFFPGSGIPKVPGAKVEGLTGYSIKPNKLQANYNTGDKVNLSIRVKNDFAGHKVPTGDPERFFLIRYFVDNQKGENVYKKTFRIGEEWQWHPSAKKLSDNNILPGEAREFTTEFEIESSENLTWKVLVSKHRINKESLRYHHLEGIYPDSIVVYDKTFEITVGK